MTDEQSQPKDPSSLTYEEARDELAAIVANLEEGTSSLDQSLNLWERGEALAKRCTQWLDSAQARLDSADNSPTQTDPLGQSDGPVPEVVDRGTGDPVSPIQATFSSDPKTAPADTSRPPPTESAPVAGGNNNPVVTATSPKPPKKPKSPPKPAETQPKLQPAPSPGPPPTGSTRGKATDPPW